MRRLNPADPRRRRAERAYDGSDPAAVAALIQERLRSGQITIPRVELASYFAEPLAYRPTQSLDAILRAPPSSWSEFSKSSYRLLHGMLRDSRLLDKVTDPGFQASLNLPVNPKRKWPSGKGADAKLLAPILAFFSQQEATYKACRSLLPKRRKKAWSTPKTRMEPALHLFFGIEIEAEAMASQRLRLETEEDDLGYLVFTPEGRDTFRRFLRGQPTPHHYPYSLLETVDREGADSIDFDPQTQASTWFLRHYASAVPTEQSKIAHVLSAEFLAYLRWTNPIWYLSVIFDLSMTGPAYWLELVEIFYPDQTQTPQEREVLAGEIRHFEGLSLDDILSRPLVERRIITTLLGGPPL